MYRTLSFHLHRLWLFRVVSTNSWISTLPEYILSVGNLVLSPEQLLNSHQNYTLKDLTYIVHKANWLVGR